MRLLLSVLAVGLVSGCDLARVDAEARKANEAIVAGRLGEARSSLKTVIDDAALCEEEKKTWVRAMLGLAAVERLAGHVKEGLAWAQRGVAAAELELGDDPVLLAEALETLAQLQAAAGKYYDAEPVIRRAIEIQQRRGGNNRAELASAINTLAVLYLGLADPDGARRQLHRALQYGRESGADLVVASALHNLATAAWQEGHSEESLKHLEDAIGIAEKQLGRDHPYLAGLFESYARVLAGQHRKSEARTWRVRAKTLQARFNP